MSAQKALECLRAEIVRLCKNAVHPAAVERLDFRAHGDRFHVFFFGSPFGEPYGLTIEALSANPIANCLLSFSLDDPDEGSNGTRNWDIARLATSAVPFPALRHLQIAHGQPDHHNRTIVAEAYEEDGAIGCLVAKAPMLETLISPSAPSRNFFDAPLRQLTTLAVDAGYDAQGFIEHLTQVSPPNLQSFAWGEYAETYVDDWIDRTTGFSSMVGLFQSSAFDTIRNFVLKNPTYSDQELRQLAGLRPGLQFKVVRTSSAYCGR